MQYAIQRVIQTDLYFQPMEIKWKFPELVFNTPGVSMAFFRGDSRQMNWPEVVSTARPRGKAPTAVVRAFLDAALQNAPHIDVYQSTPELNGPIIDAIYNQHVITESSPAESTPFQKLLGSASIITVGTLVGIVGFTGSPILFVAVPAGILAVGASAVVLEWLRRGGSHLIDRALKARPRKRGPKVRKRSRHKLA